MGRRTHPAAFRAREREQEADAKLLEERAKKLGKMLEIDERVKRLGTIAEVDGNLVVVPPEPECDEELPFGDPRSFPVPERDAWLAEQRRRS